MNSFELEWNDEEVHVAVKGACKKACLDAANEVAIQAKMNVPVDTGELRSSITVFPWEYPDAVGAYVCIGGHGRFGGATGMFVELGTPGEVYRVSGGGHRGRIRTQMTRPRTPIKAQPYLRPALRKKKPQILNKFRNRLK